MLKQYFQDIFDTSKTGDAREESYYPDLKNLIENYSQKKKKKYLVTTLPKKTEAGNPDFRIWDGKQHIVGYIEAKKPTTENLEIIEDTEQLQRYRSTFPNLILTNFFEFRLYRNGQQIDKVKIGNKFLVHKIKTLPPVENKEKFLKLLQKFFSFSTPKTYTARQLAIELAKRTRFLRDQVIQEELKEEKIKDIQNLEGFYKAFKNHLISSLTLKEFSNLFAQTITYGLFAARSRAEDGFNRKLAYELIPHTIGILRDVFRFISSTDLSQNMEWIIDDIAEVLATADVKKIIRDFYKEGKGKDPIIHFYETFLTEFDPKERAKKGVYYTPEPVVSYIVRSIHKLLKEKFNKKDGFADQSVTVLDPASGTLTFPAMAIQQAIEEYKKKYGDGGIKSLIKNHILKNFYAFELMMAPYAIGHLKIGFLLNEYGYKLTSDERFKLFLTNTLEFKKEDPNKLPGIFEREIAKESKKALKVKEKTPVMVIIGNPPYSVSSSNIIKKSSDFYKFYESYKEKVRKEETNIQPLSDDYIKFIAFAHWKIKQVKQGIVGMITNNSYLDGLIHRDMREKLLQDFNEIYILNLHGSSKRQEKTPKGNEDKNVFDIQQGVSIILLIKKEGLKGIVNYADLWGLRNKKYNYLEKHSINSTKWKNLKPETPHCFFISKDFREVKNYKKFISLKDIFIKSNAGVATGKDKVLLSFDRETLARKLSVIDRTLFEIGMKNDGVNKKLIDDWFNELKKINVKDQIQAYSYRPFNDRFVIYNNKILQRARQNLMNNFLHNNLGLITTKQLSSNAFYHAFVTKDISDRCLISLQTREVSYVFPLYLYNNNGISQQESLLNQEGNSRNKSVNFNWSMLPGFCSTIQAFTSPATKDFIHVEEAIFYYIYAILYSNVYRQKYQEFLKIDFPRIPFITDYSLFRSLAILGEQLVKLHLLKLPILDYPIAKFPSKGSNQVEKREYRDKRVYINDRQYFSGVIPEAWNYYVGGYQVLDKWLKDRKEATLSSDDIKHYCRLVTALSKTIEMQKRIDNIYPEVEKNLLTSLK